MNRGTAFAILILAAYLGVEIFAFQKVSYRTEPAYIHNLLIETRTATDICNSDVGDLSERFDRTLARVTENFRKDLVEQYPESGKAELELKINEREKLAQQRIAQSLTLAQCTEQPMKDHLVRFRIYAKKSR